MVSRVHISGPHFRALDSLEAGAAITDKKILADLIKWGYVTETGAQRLTAKAKRDMRTWREMRTGE